MRNNFFNTIKGNKMMKKAITVSLLSLSILFASCQGGHSETASDTEDTAETVAKDIKPTIANVDGAVTAKIQEVFDHYIHVKTALVNSDAPEAQNGARAIVSVIDGFDASVLPAEQKAEYEKSVAGIRTSAQAITGESDLEKQRTIFAELSKHTYALIKTFGANRTVYHDHCPMALNDKGANWLSDEKDIKNPYFGKDMLECGSVEEVIQAK
jgi:hypothetical protein